MCALSYYCKYLCLRQKHRDRIMLKFISLFGFEHEPRLSLQTSSLAVSFNLIFTLSILIILATFMLRFNKKTKIWISAKIKNLFSHNFLRVLHSLHTSIVSKVTLACCRFSYLSRAQALGSTIFIRTCCWSPEASKVGVDCVIFSAVLEVQLCLKSKRSLF